MTPRYLLDTNVLIRFLLDDDLKQSPHAKLLFEQATKGDCLLILTDVAIAESVWVLTSVYNLSRGHVANTLGTLLVLAGIKCSNRDCVVDALLRFKSTNCDFMDCYLAAMAAASGNAVASFDRDMRKFKDVELWRYDDQK